MTLGEAQMRLSELLMERGLAGLSNELQQIDAVLGEDFETVHTWIYFRDGSDALIAVDFEHGPIDPASFDPDGFAAALTALPSVAKH